jgi:hypothetical protein
VCRRNHSSSKNILKSIDFEFELLQKDNYFGIISELKKLRPDTFWEKVKILGNTVLELDLVETEDMPLNWTDVKLLSDSKLFNLGTHTSTHAKISNLSDSELHLEILESLNAFKSNGLEAVNFFPIPFGQAEDFELKQLELLKKDFNLKSLSTKPLSVGSTSSDLLPRISVQNWTSEYLSKVINYAIVFSKVPILLEPSMRIRRTALKALNQVKSFK